MIMSDADLMLRVQADDADAFEQLYDRHAARAFRVARSICATTSGAEDAVQEGFLAIWRSRASYRPETGSFKGWSMRIVRNRALDSARRDAARPRLAAVEGAETQTGSPAGGLVDGVIARTEAAALRDALARLPASQAEVIALAYFGELTHTEITKQLDLPAGTVKGRMRLGLKKLRTQLEGERRGRSDADTG